MSHVKDEGIINNSELLNVFADVCTDQEAVDWFFKALFDQCQAKEGS
jgi:hypothetical protein